MFIFLQTLTKHVTGSRRHLRLIVIPATLIYLKSLSESSVVSYLHIIFLAMGYFQKKRYIFFLIVSVPNFKQLILPILNIKIYFCDRLIQVKDCYPALQSLLLVFRFPILIQFLALLTYRNGVRIRVLRKLPRYNQNFVTYHVVQKILNSKLVLLICSLSVEKSNSLNAFI